MALELNQKNHIVVTDESYLWGNAEGKVIDGFVESTNIVWLYSISVYTY